VDLSNPSPRVSLKQPLSCHLQSTNTNSQELQKKELLVLIKYAPVIKIILDYSEEITSQPATISLKLDMTFPDSDAKLEELKNDFCRDMKAELKTNATIIILEIRSGSVLIDFIVLPPLEESKIETHMDASWNRDYGKGLSYWDGANNYENYPGPYYCPVGWKRYGIKVDNFDQRCKNKTYVAYCGTNSNDAQMILQGYMDPNQISINPVSYGNTSVFVTPSIEYASQFSTSYNSRSGKAVRAVVQLRVKEPDEKTLPTLPYNDPLFPPEEAHWIYNENPTLPMSERIIVYGFMVRIQDSGATTTT